MAKAWMPGAERIDGGPAHTVKGAGAPRAVWTVTGSDPGVWSAAEEARRLLHEGRTTHLVWNPVSGEVVQLLAATRRAGMALGGTTIFGRHLDHGDEGRVCLVVAVVGTKERPFTDGPMTGLSTLLGWLDSWGVSRTWPAGPPGRRGVGGGATVEAAVRCWSSSRASSCCAVSRASIRVSARCSCAVAVPIEAWVPTRSASAAVLAASSTPSCSADTSCSRRA